VSAPAVGLYSKMAGDSTLTGLLGGTFIYPGVAPPTHNANQPWVVYWKQAGTPQYTLGKGHAFDTEVWTIKAVERNTTSARVDAIAARLDALLTDATLTITGKTTMGLWRESDVEFTETDGDEIYRHAGAMYRLIYQ
jgi:hypothetical protein